MPQLAEIEQQIAQLSPSEKEDLLHRLTGEVVPTQSMSSGPYLPGIVKTPEVCGGVARIIRTRIPVWTLERMRQLGVQEADILRSFPSLRAVDLVQAWLYADTHLEEIERQIRENEED